MVPESPRAGREAIHDLTSQLSAMGVRPASGNPDARKLASGIPVLDEFLEGGLPVGAVIEWGAPLGRGGREVILSWLARATQPAPTGATPGWGLWVYSRAQLTVYPPAWLARGVALGRMRFACSPAPVADLRPAFMESLFRVIVLDGPRTFTEDDCAFVARQARAHGQVVMVLRDHFLGPARGNVWARLRLNCWQDHASRQYRLRVVRGMSPRQLALSEAELRGVR